MATEQDEGIPIISGPCPTVPKPQCLPVPGPSGVLTPPPVTFPLPASSLPDIPLAGTPLLGCPFADLAIPLKGKWDHSPMLPTQNLRLGVCTAAHRAMTIHPI